MCLYFVCYCSHSFPNIVSNIQRMGQSLKKLASGIEDQKGNEIDQIIEKCYDKYFGDTQEGWTFSQFNRAVCETVEEINKKIGSTQFRVPKVITLTEAYNKHHPGGKGKSLTKEEFEKILQDVIKDTGLTGIAAKNIIFYIFGIPATVLLFKQKVAPKLVPNEILIPVVTSASVFLLAKFNKI